MEFEDTSEGRSVFQRWEIVANDQVVAELDGPNPVWQPDTDPSTIVVTLVVEDADSQESTATEEIAFPVC